MRKKTRDHIVMAADRLFYERGYEHTSFADIAAEVAISRGNFYHHFKTKDEILEAVIAVRLTDRAIMLGRWEAEVASPLERVMRFVKILIVNQSKIKQHGCPVGTLCTELSKLDHAQQDGANGIMDLFRQWLTRQFRNMGRERDADDLAMHVLMRSQGIAVLANTYRDDTFVRREVELAEAWLRSELATSTTV